MLELSSCTRISIGAIRTLANVSDSLRCLSLSASTQLTDADLLELSTLKSLEKLDLSGCRGLTDVVVEAIVSSCGGTLEEINLSHTPDSGFTQEPLVCRVTDQSMAALARLCPKLKAVTLQSCSTVTDEGLQKLASGCRYLHTVNVAKCKSFTDEGISALAKGCPLQTLILDSAGKETPVEDEEKATQEAESKHGITDKCLLQLDNFNKKTLVHLDLSWCRYVHSFLIACFYIRGLLMTLFCKHRLASPLTGERIYMKKLA